MYEKAVISIIVSIVILLVLLSSIFFIRHNKYTNEDCNIEIYISSIDKDLDGIDDQTDILMGVREYIKTHPKYKSKDYSGGYPNDNYGVCTVSCKWG